MRLSHLSSMALAATLGGQAQAQTKAVQRPQTVQELAARIRGVLDTNHVPGAGLALVTRDSVIYTGGIGKADVASRRDATGATLFRLGSTSKTFTSLVVMMLQDEGKLRLDDPIKKYIPEIRFENRWETTDPVRIANALEHTTGFDDLAFRDFANNDPTPLTLKQGLDFNPASRVSRWRPGTLVTYCNTGPPLAAYIAEKLEGRPFEDIVQTRLFNPLGMKTATYLRPDASRLSVATLYAADGKTAVPYWNVIMRPAGAINASAEDMAPYVRFLLNRGMVDGRPLLPAADIERIERSETSITAKSGLSLGYGLHLATYVDSGFVWAGHDGSVGNGLTTMAYLPKDGVGFAVMINAGNHDALNAINALIRHFLTKDITPPAPPPAAPLSALARTVYTGWYQPDNPRQEHLHFMERIVGLTRVTADDSGLMLRPVLGKATRRVPVSDKLFRGVDEPVATMALVADTADGRPVAIEQMGYMLPASFAHMPTPEAWLEIIVTSAWLLVLVLTVLVGAVGLLLSRRRRRQGKPPLGIAGGLATVTFIAAATCFLVAASGDPSVIGTRNVWTVGTYVLFMAFAVLALVALVRNVRNGGKTTSHLRAWLNRVAVSSHAIVAAYLTYWGFIGWRMWS